MSTRAELKSRAKSCLRHYYWWAVLACFLAGILGGGNSSSIRLNLGGTQGATMGQAMQQSGSNDENGLMALFFVLSFIMEKRACERSRIWKKYTPYRFLRSFPNFH